MSLIGLRMLRRKRYIWKPLMKKDIFFTATLLFKKAKLGG